LTPTESSLLTQSAPSEAEALGASSGIVRRKAERAFLALIALPTDDQFLEDDLSVNFLSSVMSEANNFLKSSTLISD